MAARPIRPADPIDVFLTYPGLILKPLGGGARRSGSLSAGIICTAPPRSDPRFSNAIIIRKCDWSLKRRLKKNYFKKKIYKTITVISDVCYRLGESVAELSSHKRRRTDYLFICICILEPSHLIVFLDTVFWHIFWKTMDLLAPQLDPRFGKAVPALLLLASSKNRIFFFHKKGIENVIPECLK